MTENNTAVTNRISIQGQVATKHKLRHSASGTPVLDLTVRVDSRTWHKIVVFGRLAESIHEYTKVGQSVQITGRMAENGKVVARRLVQLASVGSPTLPKTEPQSCDAGTCPTCHRQMVPLNTGFSHSDVKYCPHCEK